MVERGGVAHIQAGAGIVYDSVPSSELEECRNKANALIEAVAMAESVLSFEFHRKVIPSP